MKKTTKWIVAGLGLAQLSLGVGVAQAQNVNTLNEVVVSTTKNNQKQWQSGKVITIVDSATLAHSAGKSVAELLNQQAGIQVLGAGSTAGKDKSIFIRGAAAAYAVVLIDGIPASDPSSIGSPFDLKLLSTDQIERIEILRGGQSTLYGSDAVAGVINIITKKAQQNGGTVNGMFSAGSYNTYQGTIGMALKKEDFSYNINYTRLKSKGFSEAERPAGNTQNFDKDGTDQNVLNANFAFQLEKGLTISPFLRYSQVKFDYDNNAFVDAANQSTSKNFNGGAQVVYQLNTAKFTLNASQQNTERVYKSMFPSSYKGTVSQVDFFYNQQLGSKLNLLLGIDSRNQSVTYYNPNGTHTPSNHINSAYGSLFLHDLSIFNLEVGGRFNKHSNYGKNSTYTITPSFVLGKNVKVFGTASSSFRAPVLDMLFGAWGANLNLKPEQSEQLEAGVDLSFFDQKLNVKTAFFKREIKDAIIYGMTGYINQDKQKADGFEIEPSYKTDKFTIGGFYSQVSGKTISGNVVSTGLLRRPKYIYGLNAGYQLTNNLYASTQYKYADKRSDTYFNPNTFVSEPKTLAAYGLLDFYAEYTLAKKRVKLFVDLKNLTDEKYTEIYGYSTMGFNTNAGVTFNF